MIQVFGDEIVLEGVTIGKLSGAWPTLEDRARDLLESAMEDAISPEESREIEDESYARGRTDMREDLASELRAANEKGYNEGFDQGRAAAIADMDFAKDLSRVEALLQAISKAHDALFLVTGKRRPAAKQSELKDAAILNLSMLRSALQAYRAPNGA